MLARLNEKLGTAGLAAAAAVPGLAAVVDQHSAAVRDILAFGVEESAAVAGVVLLAGYAQGLLDHARDTGNDLDPPADPAAWVQADWLTTRLLGVCALAASIDDPDYRLGDADSLMPVAEHD
jgi:hypothetical protein